MSTQKVICVYSSCQKLEKCVYPVVWRNQQIWRMACQRRQCVQCREKAVCLCVSRSLMCIPGNAMCNGLSLCVCGWLSCIKPGSACAALQKINAPVLFCVCEINHLNAAYSEAMI